MHRFPATPTNEKSAKICVLLVLQVDRYPCFIVKSSHVHLMSTQDRYSSSLLIGVPIIVVIRFIYIYIKSLFWGEPPINYIINRVYLSGVDFKENSVKASYPVHRSHPKSTNLGLELVGCWENPKLDCNKQSFDR